MALVELTWSEFRSETAALVEVNEDCYTPMCNGCGRRLAFGDVDEDGECLACGDPVVVMAEASRD